MAVKLLKTSVISAKALKRVAETRLKEARALLKQGHFAGAIYLAGYAVECYLKAAICHTLAWEDLRGTFKTHDLEGLLLYSGFQNELNKDSDVRHSFAKILDIWVMETRQDGKVPKESVRYSEPSAFSESEARRFLQYVAGRRIGVVPWLKGMLS